MKKNHKILITTGIYPPKIGGPAQYAKNLKEAFEKAGSSVLVETFIFENYLPSGLRHLFFFLKIIPDVLISDIIFVLDTFSVALPSVLAGKIFGKKTIIRTGGDFLWEQYVERTRKSVLLRNFYQTEQDNFSLKEKIIFKLTHWTLRNASKVIFSTDWQRQIFLTAYGLRESRTAIVENYYGPKQADENYEEKNFIASARCLEWKNLDLLKEVFAEVNKETSEAKLFMDNMPYSDFMEKMKTAYAVILVSLGDISPNMILDAIRLNRPFICTKEVGIYDRIKASGAFVDPLDRSSIKAAILNMLDPHEYYLAKQKVKNFNFVHTWDQIAAEFLEIANKN